MFLPLYFSFPAKKIETLLRTKFHDESPGCHDKEAWVPIQGSAVDRNLSDDDNNTL
jgi:hypothetical protein